MSNQHFFEQKVKSLQIEFGVPATAVLKVSRTSKNNKSENRRTHSRSRGAAQGAQGGTGRISHLAKTESEVN